MSPDPTQPVPFTPSPAGLTLPPSEGAGLRIVPASVKGNRIGRGKRPSAERVRVARYTERAMLYRVLVERPGQVLTYADLAAITGLDRTLTTAQANSLTEHPDDYPHLARPARGTLQYVGPPVELPALPPSPTGLDAPRQGSWVDDVAAAGVPVKVTTTPLAPTAGAEAIAGLAKLTRTPLPEVAVSAGTVLLVEVLRRRPDGTLLVTDEAERLWVLRPLDA